LEEVVLSEGTEEGREVNVVELSGLLKKEEKEEIPGPTYRPETGECGWLR
jgi:hypothetical protein